MTGQELYEHVQQLAYDLDVPVWVCMACGDGDAYGEALRTGDDEHLVVLTNLPDESVPYLIALHELGHVATGFGGYRLDNEADAWAWAIEQSLIPIDWAVILDRLQSYARDRRFKHTNNFTRLITEAERRACQSSSLASQEPLAA